MSDVDGKVDVIVKCVVKGYYECLFHVEIGKEFGEAWRVSESS